MLSDILTGIYQRNRKSVTPLLAAIAYTAWAWWLNGPSGRITEAELGGILATLTGSGLTWAARKNAATGREVAAAARRYVQLDGKRWATVDRAERRAARRTVKEILAAAGTPTT